MNTPLVSDKSIAELSDEELKALADALEDEPEGQRGGQLARVASFLGLWRSIDGANLRVGLREGDSFMHAKDSATERVKPGDAVSIVLGQLRLPNLPHDRCSVQVTWQASHWFDDAEKIQIAHVTTCDASEDGSATAVGVPIFDGMKVEDGIGLSIGIYVSADKESRSIVDLLGGSAFSSGLKLAAKFNPVFAMTGPYIQAAVGGLTRASRRNFKVTNWKVGLGNNDSPMPLVYGDYILLDGILRSGRETHTLEWSKLTWDGQRDAPAYDGQLLRAPYLTLRIMRSRA